MVLGAGMVHGQDFPHRPIRIYTTAPGGGSDFSARIIAQTLPASLGQPVIVENRGGSVTIAATEVMKAPPDGHSLLLYGSTLWLLPYLHDKVPYDPLRDFLPVTMTNRAPNVLVVHASLPVKSVQELIALARARPGELNYSSGPSGSSNHLSAEVKGHGQGQYRGRSLQGYRTRAHRPSRGRSAADVRYRFHSGTETIGGTPEELAAAIRAEMTGMGKVIKDGNIRAQ